MSSPYSQGEDMEECSFFVTEGSFCAPKKRRILRIGQEVIPDRTSLFLFCACEIDCRKQANRGRITFILIISFKIELIKSENLFQPSAYIFRFRLHFAVQ